MKRRVVKKVERMQLVDKVCELQRQIDEYDRFLGDLLIMLNKKEPQTVIKHECGDWADWIWEKVRDLIKENKEHEKD